MSVGKKIKPEVPVLPPLVQPRKSDAASGSGGIKILSATGDAAFEVKNTERLCCTAFGYFICSLRCSICRENIEIQPLSYCMVSPANESLLKERTLALRVFVSCWLWQLVGIYQAAEQLCKNRCPS